eukprot:4360284-Prymnesium_polylepis.1
MARKQRESAKMARDAASAIVGSGGGHVLCAGRSQQRAVLTTGKGDERVVRQPSPNQTTHTHSTQ